MGLSAVIAVSVVLLAGCGGSKAKTIDADALAESLVNDIAYEDTLSRMDADAVSNYIDIVDGTEGIMYMSSGSTAESVAVFTTTDENSAKVMEGNVQMYLDDQKSAFEDYMPEEAKRIEDAVLEQKGNYVILCVSGDPDTAESIIDKAFED